MTIATIKLVELLGAEVLITYTSTAEKEFICEYGGVDKSRLIANAAATLAHDIDNIAGDRGINLALTLSHSSNSSIVWSRLGPGGQFVIVGTRGKPALNSFDMSVFTRGASIVAIDMLELLRKKPSVAGGLMADVLDLYRRKAINVGAPATRFDLNDLSTAIRTVSSEDYFGRLALDCDYDKTAPIYQPEPSLTFNPDAAYVLVGCLGGLGRSLTTWMVARGARHLIFLSRSGTDNPVASSLVAELHKEAKELDQEITTEVVRGDVSIREDVNRAIAAASRPVRGVIQAAMVLKDSLFEDMSLDNFNAVIQPKVQGTIHLHEALLHEPLDFFVMTSSLLGSIGTSTQGNYAAANTFQDYMARHRWSLGLQATSIALGMIVEVGHVEMHPAVEEALRRNGMYGIDEDEYLLMMEDACRKKDFGASPWGWDDSAQAHIISGLDPIRLAKAGGKAPWFEDNRLRNVVMAIDGASNKDDRGSWSNNGKGASATATPTLLKEAREEGGEAAVRSMVQTLVLQKLSSLVLIPMEKLVMSLDRPLGDFGMDSMITAELRTWAWREFKADVPFMKLLGSGQLVGGVVDMVWDKMDSSFKL
ncbi:hypothetical protein MBLNU459_g5031t2 [Dothideomycetes sp. NU459]